MGPRKVTEGVLDFGDWLSKGREHYEWVRRYYADRGWPIKNLRAHVLERYRDVLDQFSFGDLFISYVDHLGRRWRDDVIGVANDNDVFCQWDSALRKAAAALNEDAVARARAWSARARYPKLTWHPFWRVSKVLRINGRDGLVDLHASR